MFARLGCFRVDEVEVSVDLRVAQNHKQSRNGKVILNVLNMRQYDVDVKLIAYNLEVPQYSKAKEMQDFKIECGHFILVRSFYCFL